MSLQISILTPEKPFWNGQAEEIILPTETGEMGVLKNHAPIVSALGKGNVKINAKGLKIAKPFDRLFTKSGDNYILPINSGTIELNNNKIIVLVD
mgnify:CR=1 FL=1